MNILDFQKRKNTKLPISMVTCYDFWTARILNTTNIDCILVGDTLAMIMHGHTTTLPATIDLIALHVETVVRGAPDKFIVGDMPFLSYRKDLTTNMNNVEKLMRAGAQAIKLEGVVGNLELITHIVNSGIPVMGHIGLTPQSLHQLGGFRLQGKSIEEEKQLIKGAQALQEVGCFAIVLECIPNEVAKQITSKVQVPTIGIGAGPHVDGQVLVLQDLLGVDTAFKPKFLKHYMDGFELIKDAVNRYDSEVKTKVYPSIEESYS